MKRINLFFIAAFSLSGSYLFYSCTSSGSSSGSVQIKTQDISEWREEARTGVSSETGLMEKWPEEGPALIWSNENLLSGYSSVTFGKNSIFLTGSDGQNDFLFAIDNNGKIKWQTLYGRSWTKSNPEARCTPTVDGDRIYVSSGFGDLACIDGSSGKIVWSVKASEIYKGTFGDWGIAESLIVDGDKVYFTPGGQETMTIALNKNTGDLVWKSPGINDGPAYVSPLMVDYQGKRMIVDVSLHNIFAVDASDGSIMWKVNHVDSLDARKSIEVWPDAPFIKCVTPLYHDGKIYMTGGYNHGSMMLKLAEDGKNANVAWRDSILDVHHGGVVLVNGYIYGSNWRNNSDGNWCCLDWNTGKKMYEEHWKSKGSIISAGGMLYILDEKSGNVGLIKANPEKFDLVSSFRVKTGSGPYWAHLVINNGNLYVRHGKALMVYNIKKQAGTGNN
jgi:outer membrane protein assembly factor BamB